MTIALLLGVMAIPASAAPVRLALGYEGTLESIACPSNRQCTAISDAGQEWTFDPRHPGTPKPTTIDAAPVESATGLESSLHEAIVCPSTRQCTVVDSDGREVTFDPVSPGHRQPLRIDNGERGSGEQGSDEGELAFGERPLACPSASQCTAVDDEGDEVTFDPLAPGTPSPVTIAAHSSLRLLACPSASQCTAADTGGRELTFDPLAPRPAAPVAIASQQLTSLACPSARLCVTFDEGGRELTFDPLAPRPAVVSKLKGNIVAYGLACPLASQCTAAGGGGEYTTFNPRVPGTLVPIDVSAITLTAVACASASRCASVDMLGQEETFNPTSAVVSGASLSGVARRAARLSFTFTAGTSTAPLKTISVSLPHGLSLSSAERNLASGISADAGNRRLSFSARASDNRLAITLKAPAWRVTITIRGQAIAVARTLAQDVSAERVRALAIDVRATSAGNATTSAKLRFNLAARRPLRLGIPPSVRAELLMLAKRAAATSGDRHPYDIEAVRTTHGVAERVVEEGDESEPPSKGSPVYVIAIRGHFRCDLCSRPPRTKAPSGTVITLELLAPLRKRGASAFGLSSRYPNLKALGMPVHLEPPRSHPHRP